MELGLGGPPITLYGGLCGGSDWIEPMGPWYMSNSSEASGEHFTAILFSCFVTIRRHFARAFWNHTCKQKTTLVSVERIKCIQMSPAKRKLDSPKRSHQSRSPWEKKRLRNRGNRIFHDDIPAAVSRWSAPAPPRRSACASRSGCGSSCLFSFTFLLTFYGVRESVPRICRSDCRFYL